MIFLDLEDLLHIADRTLNGQVLLRDVGLLDAAAQRPLASAFGKDAYASLHDKGAALLHAIVRNHPLVDGNKRLGLASVLAFYGVNGYRFVLTNDEAYELVMAIASGQLDEVADIACRLRSSVEAL
ncbi:MAG: type II toxin-antitoxin system death-on-curing family toxin [Actinomycetes bacterium]